MLETETQFKGHKTIKGPADRDDKEGQSGRLEAEDRKTMEVNI